MKLFYECSSVPLPAESSSRLLKPSVAAQDKRLHEQNKNTSPSLPPCSNNMIHCSQSHPPSLGATVLFSQNVPLRLPWLRDGFICTARGSGAAEAGSVSDLGKLFRDRANVREWTGGTYLKLSLVSSQMSPTHCLFTPVSSFALKGNILMLLAGFLSVDNALSWFYLL